jgi:hypothetical protein
MTASTHNGVLIPAEMHHATPDELDAYAARVRAGNRAVIEAYWSIVDMAGERGLSLEDLDR